MRTVRSLVVLLILGIVTVGCQDSDIDPSKNEKIENVVRVLMQNPSRYTLLIDVGGNKIDQRDIVVGPSETMKPQIFTDVPKNEKMWVYVERYNRRWQSWERVDIHIYSERNIEGSPTTTIVPGLIPFSSTKLGHTHVLQ